MAEVRNNNFYIVAGWMINELHLADKELIVYAIIYSFSQDGESEYKGGLKFLSKWIGRNGKPASTTTTMKVLNSLVEKGLIEKRPLQINGITLCNYAISKTDRVYQKLIGGIAETDNNNKEIIKDIYKEREIIREGNFRKPSVDEVREYCESRNNGIDAEEFIAFYESKGWMVGSNRMKDWKSAVITWEKSRRERASRPAPQRRESVLERNLKAVDQMFGSSTFDNIYGKGVSVDEQ